jgi:GDP-D-mannose 3',5'-epimerase
MKTALVLGAGGFIGNHLVNSLKKEGFWVRGVDLKFPEYSSSRADNFLISDLKKLSLVKEALFSPKQKSLKRDSPQSKFSSKDSFDEVYQLAADMGGAGFIFSGENDANIMHNSALINLNVCKMAIEYKAKKIFYASSACIYPQQNQMDPKNPNCSEDSAYPANPDSEYGWEKLFSERMFIAFHRNYGLNIRIARFHNIFGPEGSYAGGREKAPAAFCRKVALANNGDEIEMWGDGEQTRSFLFIDECLRGIRKLMDSTYTFPLNIGSEEMVSINTLAKITMKLANKNLKINHISGPLGVKGRKSDNNLIKEKLNWEPSYSLKKGLEKTYPWVLNQINKSKK